MTVTITTALPHGFNTGDTVCLEDIAWILLGTGENPGQLNGESWCVDTVPSTTQMTIIACELATKIAHYAGDTASQVLQGYQFDGEDWTTLGNPLSVPVAFDGFGSLTGLGATTWDGDLTNLSLAWVDDIAEEIRTYTFNGTDWALTGNAFSLTGNNFQTALATMSATRIAFMEGGNIENLTAYDWDGTDWTVAGNVLNISFATPMMAGLSSTRIALLSGQITTYNFDGTNWTSVGNTLGGLSTTGVAALSSTRVVILDSESVQHTLQTYDFDGTDWTTTGNALNVSHILSVAGSVIDAMSPYRIVVTDAGPPSGNGLRFTTYDFDGTDWVQVGNTLVVASSGSDYDNPRICSRFIVGAAPDTTGWTAYDSGGEINQQVSTVTASHLEGEPVVGTADGVPFTGKTVSSGTINLEACKAQVGLQFCHRFKSLKQNFGAPSGEAMGKTKRIGAMSVALLWASDFTYGDDLLDTLFASTNPNTNVFTGERHLGMDSGWSSDERYVFSGCDALPWFCLAVMPEMMTNDLK